MLVILHASYEGVSMFASYIVGAARTPRGRGKRDKGALAGIHPQELFAQTLTTLQDRVGFEPREVDDVIAGCVSQVGEQGANVARNAVLAAGWPYEISAVSLNRFCAYPEAKVIRHMHT